ncbi:MAG: Coagulation factor 5/8 type domain-containing protein [Solirubrobacteraceae bacterium]
MAVALVVSAAIGPAGTAAQAGVRSPYALANRCFALRSSFTGRYLALGSRGKYSARAGRLAGAIQLYLKPTELSRYMLYDRRGGLVAESQNAVARTGTPGPPARWRIARAPGHTFTLTSTADRRKLAARHSGSLVLASARSAGRRGRFVFSPARRCRPFPEAKVGAFGQGRPSVTRQGTVFGWADLEFHLTASFRAGGEVIAGEDFDPFGVTAALSAARDEQEHGPDGTLDTTGNLLRFGAPTGRTDVHGWPTFVGWPTYDTLTNQQAYWVWLERAWRSGLRLVMANTSEDGELCDLEPRRSHSCDEERSIELQVQNLKHLQSYIDAQSGGPGRGFFRLAFGPAQARRVIKRGKLAVVIGVESSNPLGCSEHQGKPQCTRAQINRGLARWWKLGIRGFFPVHWVDNAFAGAALEGGSTGTFLNLLNEHQTGHGFKTGRCPLPGEGVEMQPAPPSSSHQKVCNVKSLTSLGAYAIKRMMARHFMIFVDHMSEWARERVLAIAAREHYPLISPHTDIGGAWVPQDLRRIYRLGGLATATLDSAAKDVRRIRQLARYGSRHYYSGIAFGTDTGGFATLPAPDAAERPLHYPFTEYNGVRFVRERTGKKTWDFNRDGVAQYGLMADLIAEMQRRRASRTAMPLLYHSAEAYLQAWQRAWTRS